MLFRQIAIHPINGQIYAMPPISSCDFPYLLSITWERLQHCINSVGFLIRALIRNGE